MRQFRARDRRDEETCVCSGSLVAGYLQKTEMRSSYFAIWQGRVGGDQIRHIRLARPARCAKDLMHQDEVLDVFLLRVGEGSPLPLSDGEREGKSDYAGSLNLNLTNLISCKRTAACFLAQQHLQSQSSLPRRRRAKMDPGEALIHDQEAFEKDLEQLITEALTGSSETIAGSAELTSPLSPPEEPVQLATPQKRPSTALSSVTEYTSTDSGTKRVKREHSDTASAPTYDDTNLHPSRQALLDAPRLISPRSPPTAPEEVLPSIKPGINFTGSATRANAIPLGHQHTGKATSGSTSSTLSNTVRRQWDPRKTDLDYEELLKHRRNEKLHSVDRYVPTWDASYKGNKTKQQPFPFDRLPGKLRDKILRILLVSAEPIEIEYTWLRPFVKGHARVPVVMQKLTSEDGTNYLAPVPWKKLLAEVDGLKTDMRQFKGALETRGVKTKGKRSPTRFLTTGLLGVSRAVHKAAARVFYSQNTFHFSYAPAAWMQLESFLSTIGPRNVAQIKHIRITAPMFHRGMQEDYVEGAIHDLISPATRMAVIKPPARDRLLSAIQYSITTLLSSASLETLSLDLEHPMAADLWTGRYVNDKRMISVAEAETYFERKNAAITLLKKASEVLADRGARPGLTLYHFSKARKADVNEFRGRMAGLVREAERYGWVVSPKLMDGR